MTTPNDRPAVDADPEDGPTLPDVTRLKKRPDFLRVATGRKSHAALFTVQGLAHADEVSAIARVGFTVTKRVGNAVERNRIKRRLRETVRTARHLGLLPTHDYVIVARRDVLTAPFPMLASGLKKAMRKLQTPPSSGRISKLDAERRADAGTRDS